LAVPQAEVIAAEAIKKIPARFFSRQDFPACKQAGRSRVRSGKYHFPIFLARLGSVLPVPQAEVIAAEAIKKILARFFSRRNFPAPKQGWAFKSAMGKISLPYIFSANTTIFAPRDPVTPDQLRK
jgi:hypothetical protein